MQLLKKQNQKPKKIKKLLFKVTYFNRDHLNVINRELFL